MRCYHSDRSEFVILYGRRRIGKTFLVNQVLGQKLTFELVCMTHVEPILRKLGISGVKTDI